MSLAMTVEGARRRAALKSCTALRWNILGGCHTMTAALFVVLSNLGATVSFAQPHNALGFDPYVTFAGNFDAGYHKTQFFELKHNVTLAQWDSRAELWIPPFRTSFSWGPYLRFAGIGASQDQPWENAWLAGPGVGFQVYPFSLSALRSSGGALRKVLGPLRLFGEYNRLNYWGKANDWRPKKQTRFGMEHWRALHVNDGSSSWWTETWNGLSWQSANEFDPQYHAWIFANAIRGGARIPQLHALSAITPYGALESSLTDQRQYYWENRLLAGGGVRFAPSLNNLPPGYRWFNRLALYAEYLHVAGYYRQSAPPSVPDHDVRVGISVSVGEWYR